LRTKLGRNKTDAVDASHIREYCELFKPPPWAPPSHAHRQLGELQTIRAGIVAGLTEWKNRKNSGMVDAMGPTRDVFRVDKRGNLDVLKTALRESID
jgi:hypothetical protein